MTKVKVIVFDSNETLLDLAGLDRAFIQAFGDASARKAWFKQVLELFLTATVIEKYRPFEAIADSALDMVAAQRGDDEIAKVDRAAIHTAMLTLPVHADVAPALARLQDADLRLAVLTNSSAKSAMAQLEHAGVARYFDEILSAHAVKRYKPAREAYEYAAKELGVDLKEMRLIAAHSWDIAGALAVGCKGAFVRRPDKALDPHGSQPDIDESTMTAVAERLIRADG